jgi:parallel beta-helix repeat protein
MRSSLKRKVVSGMMLALFLVGMLALVFGIQSAKAESKTWTVDDDGPADFSKIQDAINAASAGDTVSVRNGTYYENNILVNKGNISLVGENRETTIVDGGKTAGVKVLVITEDNVTVTGFTIKSNIQLESGPLYIGIALDQVRNCNISGNKVTNNNYGIELSSSFNITIAANNITENGSGIRLAYSENNSITDNGMSKNGIGVWLVSSDSNNIIGNNITDNRIAIWFSSYSSHNSISGNNMANNCWGSELLRSSNNSITDNIFVKDGLYVDESYRNVVDGNVVNGKPFVYLEGVSNRIIEDAGQVILVNCNAIRVENLEISNTTVGVELWATSNSEITGNHISTNTHSGIWLVSSSNNSIFGNSIRNSNIGIRLYSSSSNKIFHNNFTDNYLQAYVPSSYDNLWDNDYSSGGNYWNDYKGVDNFSGSNQDIPGSDGIGDTPYTIDLDNTDRYPLMAQFSTFNCGTWNGKTYKVDIVSNSTVSDFCFDPNPAQPSISFNVAGENGTKGFCRVTIPKDLLWTENNWTIYVNSQLANYTLIANENHTYLYLTYNHSTKPVQIIGTHVIPESLAILMLPIFITATLLVVIAHRKRI